MHRSHSKLQNSSWYGREKSANGASDTCDQGGPVLWERHTDFIHPVHVEQAALAACEGFLDAANNADSTNPAVISFLMFLSSLVILDTESAKLSCGCGSPPDPNIRGHNRLHQPDHRRGQYRAPFLDIHRMNCVSPVRCMQFAKPSASSLDVKRSEDRGSGSQLVL
jgi:hypothetical protein